MSNDMFEMIEALRQFVIRVANNSSSATPAELEAMPGAANVVIGMAADYNDMIEHIDEYINNDKNFEKLIKAMQR